MVAVWLPSTYCGRGCASALCVSNTGDLMRAFLLTLFALAIGATTFTSEGAEFKRELGYISITGRIEAGDFRKFRSFLEDPEVLLEMLNGVALDSHGGDVNAALGIARVLQLSHATIVVKKNHVCYSSCFLIFAGGSYRLVASNAMLGVHRMTFAKPPSMAETEKMLNEVGVSVESYLRSAGIPERVIEKARETPPSEMFRITPRWLLENDIRLDYRPAFIDVVSKECGSEPLNSGRDAGQTGWLDCMEKVRWKEQQRNMPRIMGLILTGR